jgi:hypothetical protein
VSQLFKARQRKDEKLADWIHKIQTLGSQFREAALLNCSEGAWEDTLNLSDSLHNICFIQGLASYQIQMIVGRCNYHNFNEIAKSALMEESTIASKHETYEAKGVSMDRCSNCWKLGHLSKKCYLRSKGEAWVNPLVARGSGAIRQVTCFWCGEIGHIDRNCRKPLRKKVSDNRRMSGNEVRWLDRSHLTVSVGCANRKRCDCITLELDVKQGCKLYFFVDNGTDISLVKSNKLLGQLSLKQRTGYT